MNYPDNVSFTTTQFMPAAKSISTNNEDYLTLTSNVFIMRQFKMIISDVIETQEAATFIVNAELIPKTQPQQLQRLKLITNMPKTYMLTLNFKEQINEDIYSLSGRHTSGTREKARKILLAKLALSDYNENIEKTRQDTLYAYSNFITTTLFEPSGIRILENTPHINTWLIKLLG